MNKYQINYDKRCLYLTYDGDDYSFHLDNGDIGDYWNSFFHKGCMYDINFHQEDSECNPSLSVYKCNPANDGFWINDGIWIIDTSNYELIPLEDAIGNPNNYFNN